MSKTNSEIRSSREKHSKEGTPHTHLFPLKFYFWKLWNPADKHGQREVEKERRVNWKIWKGRQNRHKRGRQGLEDQPWLYRNYKSNWLQPVGFGNEIPLPASPRIKSNSFVRQISSFWMDRFSKIQSFYFCVHRDAEDTMHQAKNLPAS